MNPISYIVVMSIPVVCSVGWFLRNSYVEASINARKMGALVLLTGFGGIGYTAYYENSAELYTVPLLFFGASVWSGTSMYVFDWLMAKQARNSDCAS